MLLVLLHTQTDVELGRARDPVQSEKTDILYYSYIL